MSEANDPKHPEAAASSVSLGNLHDRLLAPVAQMDSEGVITADLGELARMLLLIEEPMLESYGMSDLPALITALGSESFLALLESGHLRIKSEAWHYGEIGNGPVYTNAGAPLVSRTPLPPLSFALAQITGSAPDEDLEHYLGHIRGLPFSVPVRQRLEDAIVGTLVRYSSVGAVADKSFAALTNDLNENQSLVKAAVATSLSQELHQSVSAADFELRLEQDEPHVWRAVTDVETRFGLAPQEADQIVQSGLFAIANLHMRISEMDTFNTLAGVRPAEKGLLQLKLGMLSHLYSDPSVQAVRFDRVVALAGLPDLSTTASNLNVERLLEARESPELRELRRWLGSVDQLSDAELSEVLAAAQPRLAAIVHSSVGKTMRFLARNIAGGVAEMWLGPGTGQLAAPAVDAIDTFLIERLLPEPGPVSFLSATYPTLFKEQTAHSHLPRPHLRSLLSPASLATHLKDEGHSLSCD